MAPHSSPLAWKIPWTEEPGRLQFSGVSKSRTRLSDFTFTFHFHALGKEMATHSSVLAWRIPGMGEPGGVSDSLRPHGLQPTWLFRPWDFPGKRTGVGCHCLLLLLPRKSDRHRSLAGYSPWGCKE